MKKIHVVPTASGLKLVHPTGGELLNRGGLWPDDQFTARRLRDGDIEESKVTTPDITPPIETIKKGKV